MAITLIQSKSQQFASSSSARTLAFTANVTTGSLIVVGVATAFGGSGITVTVSDNLNGAHTQAGGYGGASNNRASVWYFVNTTPGACTVTVTPSASTYVTIAIHEYAGVATSSALDGTNSNAATSSTQTTGSVPVNNPDTLVFGAISGTSTPTAPAASAPYSFVQQKPNAFPTGASLLTLNYIGASAASTPTMTSSNTIGYQGAGASFKPLVETIANVYPPEFRLGPTVRAVPIFKLLLPPPPLDIAPPPTYPINTADSYPPEVGRRPYFLPQWASLRAAMIRDQHPPPPVPAPPSDLSAPMVWTGPRVPGVVWTYFLPVRSVPAFAFPANDPPPDLIGPQVYPPPVVFGPAIPGVLRARFVAPSGFIPTKPPVPTPTPPIGPGIGKNRPKVPRVPRYTTDTRRASHASEVIHNGWNALVDTGDIQQVGANRFVIRAGGFAAAADPTATDDVTIGAKPGSLWVNTVAGQAYVCISAAQGAAVWKQVTT